MDGREGGREEERKEGKAVLLVCSPSLLRHIQRILHTLQQSISQMFALELPASSMHPNNQLGKKCVS